MNLRQRVCHYYPEFLRAERDSLAGGESNTKLLHF
jgi:hypothetical protein